MKAKFIPNTPESSWIGSTLVVVIVSRKSARFIVSPDRLSYSWRSCTVVLIVVSTSDTIVARSSIVSPSDVAAAAPQRARTGADRSPESSGRSERA